jgi:large repetitive protein
MSQLMSRARFILVLTILVLAAATHADASPTIQVPSTFCPGGTGVATLSAPDGGGSWASVQWSITNGTIVSSQGSTLTFRNQSTALITIGASATDTNGGTFTANPATVVVHQVTAPDLDTKGSVCIGGSGTAVVRNAASYPSPITWQVTNGTITANHGASIDYTAGTSGDVLIRATSYDSNGCEVSAQWQVHIVPPPSAQITVSASACPGSFDATVPDAGVGALYDWSIQNGAIVAGAGTRQIRFVPSNGNAVTLEATVTEFYRGCSTHGTYTGEFVPADGPQIVLDRTSACPGSFVQASIEGTYSSIDWSVTNGYITADNGSSITFQVNGWGGPAQVAVSVSNGQGCSAYDAADVAVLSVDPPTVTVDKPSVCPGFGVVTATVDGQWADIDWSVINGEVLSQSGNTATVRSTSWTSGMELSAWVTDAGGCSTSTNSVQIPLRTVSPPTITVDKPSVCPGFGSVTATIGGEWSNIYWSAINGEILSQNGNTVTVRSTSWMAGIELAAWVTDVEGCSAYTNSVQIPLRTLTPPTITVDKPSVCPSFGVVTATIGGVWSNIYWSALNGEILSQNGNTVTVRSTSWSSGIELAAWVTDVEGCSAYTNSVQIPLRVIEPPVITVDKPSVCPSFGVVTATIDGVWSNIYWYAINGEVLSQTGNSVTVRSTSWALGIELNVYVSDVEGCNTSANSVQIPLRVIEPPVITVDKPSVCPSFGVVTATIDGVWSNIYWYPINGEVVSQTGNTVTVRSTSWSSGIELNVYVSDVEGCNTSANSVMVPLRVIEPPVITVDKPSVCPLSGMVTATIDGDWSTIYWSPVNGEIVNQAGNSVTVRSTSWTSAIELTAHVMDSEGCSASTNSVQIPLSSAPTVTAGGPTTFCEGGFVVLTAPAGMAGYLWSNGAIAQSITVTASGAYSVTTTDAYGCAMMSAAAVVTVNPLPAAAITAGGPTTFCEGGSVTLTAPQNSSYSWSSGATTRSITIDATGVFSVTVTNANGCSATSTPVVVTENPLPAAPVIAAGGPTTFCAGGSVTLNAPAGFTYLWSTGATTQSITVSQAGQYSVSVTNANGCSSQGSPVTVTVNPLPVATVTAGGPTTFCAGGSVTLTASAGSSYLWSNGATTQSINATAGGSYSVTVTNANGCSATSAATSVTVDALPVATVSASGPTTFCAGGSVTLTASAGSSYLWSNGAITPSIAVSAAGSYSVTVTNANGCSATSAATSVTVNALPAATVSASGPTTFCEGGSVTLTASAGSSYLWSNGATTQAIDATASGSYSVTVTNGNGCSATSAATSVTVNPLPTPSISAGGPTTFCQGGSVTLTGQGGTPSGAWYRNGSLYSTQASIVVTSSATFVYRVQTAAGCAADSAPTVVTVNATPSISSAGGHGSVCDNETVYWQVDNPTAGASIVWTLTGGVIVSGQSEARVYYQAEAEAASVHLDVLLTSTAGCTKSYSYDIPVNRPKPTISAGGPTTFCAGGSVTLTASAAPSGWTYLWSNGATTQSISVTASGTYTVRYRSVTCNAPLSAPMTVTVNPLPAATITPSGPTTFCEGGSVTLTASAGASYLWSNGATTSSINVTASGSYSVTVTSAAGCSATSAATAVTVNALPAAAITPSGPTTFCAGGSVTLTASAGSSYLWSTGATTSSINVTASGSYSVTVTNAAGCSATSAATAVTVNALPAATVTPSGPTTFCVGGSVTLTASAGASYLWSNGATTSSIDVSSSGSYSVTVSNAAGCSTISAATAVTVNALPAATITPSGPTTFCAGGSVTLTASAGSSYLWSNGATTSSINVTSSGSYSVTVTNANGCSATSAGTAVTVNALPVATITPSGPTTFCAGGSVTLTASAGASYLWSNGATTASIDVSSSGSYSVTVTSAAGCSKTSAATAVTVNALPVATITPSGPTTFCAGSSVTLIASSGSSYLWSTGATTSSINVTSSGSYSVTVTNANGCSATSAPTVVTVNAMPVATITPSGPTTFCAGGSVTLTASAGASYHWSNGATTSSINVTSSGSYSVTVTSAAGCFTTSAATAVTVNALPSATISPSGATTFCEGGSVTLTAGAGASYLWSNGATTQAINATASGSYSVTVTNGNGCSATSAATSVTVNPTPTSSISAGGPTTFCQGGSVTLTGQGGTSGQWLRDGAGYSIQNPLAVTSAGTYVYRAQTAAGCQTDSAPTVVTIDPLPSIYSAGGHGRICDNATVYWEVDSPTPGATIFWTVTGGVIVSGQNEARLYYHAEPQAASVHLDVQLTTTAGCTKTWGYDIPVDRPTPTISAGGPATFCAGGSVTLTASAAPAGWTYVWSNFATSQSINVTASGTYSVHYYRPGCDAPQSAPVTVTVNPLPTATITPSGPTTFCAGGSVTLTASAGASYLWSTGATTQAINVTSSGSYSVTVTSAAGCSKTSTAAAVTVNALPTATITPSGPTTFCAGGSVTLTASAASSYLWSTGATTQAINVTTGGNYTVTVTNAAGCSATSAPRSVTVNANPSTPVITAGGPTTFCPGGSVALTAPAGLTYLWSNGATTQSINATTTGNYTVTVTNAGGCSAVSAPKSVTVNAATAISQHPQNITIPKNTATTLTVTASGSGTLAYQWYKGTSPSTTTPVSGATSSSYTTTSLTKGTYTYWVRVTGTCGVVNSNTATVTAN